MKIDFILLIVVSAIIYTANGVMEPHNCNITEEMMTCVNSMKVLADERELGFIMHKEELDRLCPDLNQRIRCIDSYTRRCMPEDKRVHFNLLYNGTTAVISKLCNEGPYQEEFLSHAPCMRQVTTDYERCAQNYQQTLGEVHARINEQSKWPHNETASEKFGRENELRTLCCSFRDYLKCSQMIVYDKCGEKTANFTKDFLNQMSRPFIQTHCKNYPLGSDQCQDISGSASWMPRPLLLLLLAALSFYHCT